MKGLRSYILRGKFFIRDPRPIALMLAGLHGSRFTADMRALLADLDLNTRSVLFDAAEEAGWWCSLPKADRIWTKVDQHEHTWLPYFHGAEMAVNPLYRCPCGRFSNGAQAGRYPDGRRIIDVNNDGLGVKACHDLRCNMPAGHEGDHYRRWAAGHGNIGEEWWPDHADLLDERAAMDDAARDAAR